MKLHDLRPESHTQIHFCTQQLGGFLWEFRTSGFRAAEQNWRSPSVCCKCGTGIMSTSWLQNTVAFQIYGGNTPAATKFPMSKA